ncbi:osteoclast stimulatory transmembrane protein-like [Colossoma macropomum]|uniref:osteoclast stimulatory transmembrane protein-like n=1 Tax=Colossoma macropomum TaxID=42526 RepID=UPI0018653019|nr:osteoclast stimulatory transmembrane protein-like [Colossoma macropomum]
MPFVWNAYSKPCPSGACEMLTLILLCILVSFTISTLLFVWMVFSLGYTHFVAGILTGVSALVMLLLLILVHPVRCVITVTVPSLGTKQGRKIILSTALLYAITSCVPNITNNMARSLHMMKCSAGNITHSVLESCNVPKEALRDIENKLADLPLISSRDYFFKLESDVDVKDMEKSLSQVSESVKADLAMLHSTVGQVSQVLKKIIAALFVVLMIGSSVVYVKGYLTHIKHDNVYQSHQLMEALQRVSGDVTLPRSYKKKLVKTSGVRMSARELKRGLWGMLALLIYALMCGIMLGLDHFVYRSLQSLLAWTSDIPDIRATVHVQMTSLSAPEHSVLTLICTFLTIAFFMLLVEVFARRLRRKVCASFYRSREEQRTQYLLWKILEKRKRPEGSDDS